MPNTIPSWDLLRVYLGYHLRRQLDNRPPTLKEAANRMGIGSKKILDLLDEHSVPYAIVNTAYPPRYKYQELVIQQISPEWASLLGFSNQQVLASYAKLMGRKVEVKKVESKPHREKKERLRKKREKLRYFLQE